MPAPINSAERLANLETLVTGIDGKLDRLLALADEAAVFLDSPVTKYLRSRKAQKEAARGPAA